MSLFGTATSSPSIENDLMLTSARITIDEQRANRITHLIQQNIDWDQLLLLAWTQGVSTLLYNNVTRLFPEGIPPATLAVMKLWCLEDTARNLSLLDALGDVTALFTASGIRVIPYKGPMLVATVYRDAALRRTSDLDLLVHPQDYNRAKAILLDQGYLVRMNCGWKCHLTLPGYTIEGGYYLDIDLHQDIIPKWFGVEIIFDELWERCRLVAVNGMTFTNLSTEDLLTVLCIDLAKDIVEAIPFHLRLVKVTDIAEMVSRNPNISWDLLLNRAIRTGAQGALSLGLQMADYVYGISMPAHAREIIYRNSSLQSILKDTAKVFFETNHKPRQPIWSAIRELIVVIKLREDKLMVFCLWLSRIARPVILPTDRERAIVSLPPMLHFIYYLIRLIRLTIKYFMVQPTKWTIMIVSKLLGFK